MRIKKVVCQNFRNIENCCIELDDHINVILGMNAQGKTNFVESIYFLSTTRSFRINKDQDLIMRDKLFARIEGIVESNGMNRKLGCVIHDKGKSCFISNQQVPRTSEFIGKFNAILFAPSDLELFSSPPKIRRKMMDIEIGKIDMSYNYELNKFNKLVKERNSLFKQNKMNENYLDVIEQQMADCQVKILKSRKNFISFINMKLNNYYQQLAKERNEIQCVYDSMIDEDSTKLEIVEKMKGSREKDMFLKTTSIGIHRDDLKFLIDGNELNSVASQGQRRMVILGLKLVFIDYVLEKTKENPILLLDDVLSELDPIRRKNLFKIIPEAVQTLITTTDLDNLIEDLSRLPKVWIMDHGRIRERESLRYDEE